MAVLFSKIPRFLMKNNRKSEFQVQARKSRNNDRISISQGRQRDSLGKTMDHIQAPLFSKQKGRENLNRSSIEFQERSREPVFLKNQNMSLPSQKCRTAVNFSKQRPRYSIFSTKLTLDYDPGYTAVFPHSPLSKFILN